MKKSKSAAESEYPATNPANAPRPHRIQIGHLSAGSSRPARSADTDASHNLAEIMKYLAPNT